MQLRSIFGGEGRLGPMGVDQSVCRRWSMKMFEDWAVVKEVFIALICLSIKPFDFGYRGDEMIWSMACDDRNCEKGV